VGLAAPGGPQQQAVLFCRELAAGYAIKVDHTQTPNVAVGHQAHGDTGGVLSHVAFLGQPIKHLPWGLERDARQPRPEVLGCVGRGGGKGRTCMKGSRGLRHGAGRRRRGFRVCDLLEQANIEDEHESVGVDLHSETLVFGHDPSEGGDAGTGKSCEPGKMGPHKPLTHEVNDVPAIEGITASTNQPAGLPRQDHAKADIASIGVTGLFTYLRGVLARDDRLHGAGKDASK
jgi:hypothetical protein